MAFSDKSFDRVGLNAYYKTSTESATFYSWIRILEKGNKSISRYQNVKEHYGSVRCVKD